MQISDGRAFWKAQAREGADSILGMFRVHQGTGVLERTQCEERHGQSSSHRGGGFVSYWAL